MHLSLFLFIVVYLFMKNMRKVNLTIVLPAAANTIPGYYRLEFSLF